MGNFSGSAANGNATFINFGTVTGSGAALVANGNATFVNSGSIGNGILADVLTGNGSATVLNSGTVGGAVVANAEGGGIGNATVINSGSILGGATVQVISGIGNALLTNYGSISGGVNLDVTGLSVGNATFANAGRVVGDVVITLQAGSTGNAALVNAGSIVGNVSVQLIGSTGNATLTSYAGSRIIGAITLQGGPNAYLNFVGGNFVYTLTSLSGVTVNASGAPFAVSGNTVAPVDPTPFAANGRVLGDFTRNVSQVVPDFGNQPAVTGGGPMGYASSSPVSVVSSAFDEMPGRDAYAADQAVFKAPTVVQADGTAIWARGFGGYRVQQGDGGVLLRTSNTFFGGAIGFEKQVRSDLRVGAFAGGGTTRSTVELNMGDGNSNLGFGGLYARYFQGASFLYAAVQGGLSHNDTTRNISNNLLVGGLESAKGSYGGWYVSPEVKLGTHVALGRVLDAQHTLTPSIGVRYLYGAFAATPRPARPRTSR